jgi:nicotinamidase/pyrazinamidase
MKSALIVVDIQNDFLPGGALAVREGDQVVPIANQLMASGRFDLIVATQDWHPAGHGSFAAHHAGKKPGQVADLAGLPQILWPGHCVQNTPGADFAPGLETMRFERVFRKGTDPSIDSYSGFFDNGHRKSTGLGEWLKGDGVTDIYVIGLATDYCVKFTALDGVKLKFKVHLIPDACRGVELRAGDVAASIEEMKAAGVQMEGVS